MRTLQPVGPTYRPDPLTAQAARLWPDQPDLQRRWLRAVEIVRSTSRGWLLERAIRRLA